MMVVLLHLMMLWNVSNFTSNNTRTEMIDFSQKRFVDLGQTLYVEWLKTLNNAQSSTEEERRELFKFAAEMSFEAAEEFAKVFRHQEDN
jgi:hypothetical protein